jgi:hypothetical protein
LARQRLGQRRYAPWCGFFWRTDFLGRKHPAALGLPVSECWSEIWHILKPLIDTPFHGGPATWSEDLELEIDRSEITEETHFTVAYSPVPDETAPGGIGGVLATVHEITEKVFPARRDRRLLNFLIPATQPSSDRRFVASGSYGRKMLLKTLAMEIIRHTTECRKGTYQ